MKTKNVLFLMCILTCQTAFGQGSGSVLVSNAAVHVLYRWHDNPIQVSVPTVGFESVSIECDAAVIRKDENQRLWYVMPTDSTASRLTLRVFKTANGKNELLKEQVCAVVDGAMPTIVSLCSSVTRTTEKGGTSTQHFHFSDLNKVSKKSLLNKDIELVLDYPAETMKSAKLTLNGFSAQIRLTKYECTGNHFSDDAINAIAQLKQGDRILITDINATDEIGNNVSAGPCTITIK